MSKYCAHIFLLFILHICKMYVHIGEIIQKAVREKKFPITLLSQRLYKSRQHIYNIFNNPDVPLEEVLKIGKIIQYDFTEEIKSLAQLPEEFRIDILSEPEIKMETPMYWKSKYFEILEQHKLLLQGNLKAYFEKTKFK